MNKSLIVGIVLSAAAAVTFAQSPAASAPAAKAAEGAASAPAGHKHHKHHKADTAAPMDKAASAAK